MKTLITATLIAATTTGAAFAGVNADILARQTIMKAIGAAAKAGDFGALAEASNPEITIPAFTIDTTDRGDAVTEASNAIWTDFARFEGLLIQMNEKALAGDKSVFGTCKSCHADYRLK